MSNAHQEWTYDQRAAEWRQGTGPMQPVRSTRLKSSAQLASAFKPVLNMTVQWVKERGQRAC